MSLRLSKYLKILRLEASRFERTDINNNVDDGFRAKYLVKIVFAIIAGAVFYCLEDGFSEDFVSYVSSVLSILVGLFITALIFSFDKFYEPTSEEHPSSQIVLFEKQAYNYAKKFAYITSYTIVLSIFCLVFLAVSALFPEASKLNVFELSFIELSRIQDNQYVALKVFGMGMFLVMQRYFVIYFLLKIVYNTLFIVSSMVQYMTTKIDRK